MVSQRTQVSRMRREDPGIWGDPGVQDGADSRSRNITHACALTSHPILKAQTRDLEAAVNLLLPWGGEGCDPGVDMGTRSGGRKQDVVVGEFGDMGTPGMGWGGSGRWG